MDQVTTNYQVTEHQTTLHNVWTNTQYAYGIEIENELSIFLTEKLSEASSESIGGIVENWLNKIKDAK